MPQGRSRFSEPGFKFADHDTAATQVTAAPSNDAVPVTIPPADEHRWIGAGDFDVVLSKTSTGFPAFTLVKKLAPEPRQSVVGNVLSVNDMISLSLKTSDALHPGKPDERSELLEPDETGDDFEPVAASDDPYAVLSKPRVYFVVHGDYVKIGFSCRVRERISSIQIGFPEPLFIALVMFGGRDTEAALHERFASHRASGEWFKLSDEIREYVLTNGGSLP